MSETVKYIVKLSRKCYVGAGALTSFPPTTKPFKSPAQNFHNKKHQNASDIFLRLYEMRILDFRDVADTKNCDDSDIGRWQAVSGGGGGGGSSGAGNKHYTHLAT